MSSTKTYDYYQPARQPSKQPDQPSQPSNHASIHKSPRFYPFKDLLLLNFVPSLLLLLVRHCLGCCLLRDHVSFIFQAIMDGRRQRSSAQHPNNNTSETDHQHNHSFMPRGIQSLGEKPHPPTDHHITYRLPCVVSLTLFPFNSAPAQQWAREVSGRHGPKFHLLSLLRYEV